MGGAAAINKLELAWAAGFFDGEGHAESCMGRLGQVKPSRLDVAQTKGTETLERFRAAVRGLGRIYGPYYPRPDWSPRWNWRTLNFEETQAVVALLWNFLSTPKKQQITASFKRYLAWKKTCKPTPKAFHTCGCGLRSRGAALYRHMQKCQEDN